MCVCLRKRGAKGKIPFGNSYHPFAALLSKANKTLLGRVGR